MNAIFPLVNFVTEAAETKAKPKPKIADETRYKVGSRRYYRFLMEKSKLPLRKRLNQPPTLVSFFLIFRDLGDKYEFCCFFQILPETEKLKNDPKERGPWGERIVRCRPDEDPEKMRLPWPAECEDESELPPVYNLVPRSIRCQHWRQGDSIKDAVRRIIETQPLPVKYVRMNLVSFF